MFALAPMVSPLAAQDPGEQKEPGEQKGAPETQTKSEPVTEERLKAAYIDAQAACAKVLGVEFEKLPPLSIADTDSMAAVITAENLPLIQLREPDEAKAMAEAERTGQSLSTMVYAKYSWSEKSFKVVTDTWNTNARVLKRPALTSDHAVRAVMVHELCHAIDDLKFDFTKCLLRADTVDAVMAFNSVIEGHAQLMARRVCSKSGWMDGFDAFTDSIGALPKMLLDQSATSFLLRANAAAISTAYVDGERFAAAVVEARPETGSKDMFTSPPRDSETILNPKWYVDPKSRPTLLYDVEPAIDAFVAGFDEKVWTSTRNSATGKQLATGLTMLPQSEIDTILTSLRSARIVQLVPTAAPQSKVAIMIAMEFASEEAARNWIRISGMVSDYKDDTMDKGSLRITGSKTTVLEGEPLTGLMQEKKMRNGRLDFDVATIDAHKGRIVVETIFSGEPPTADEHGKLVAKLLDAVIERK